MTDTNDELAGVEAAVRQLVPDLDGAALPL